MFLFSPLETKVLKILGRKKMKIAEITKAVYKGKKKPIDANNRVAQSIRRIKIKCEYHKLGWFINGMGGGRGGKTVWLDK